jgi:hypothetical protein
MFIMTVDSSKMWPRFAVLACLVMLFLSGCALLPHRYRFKLTVEVETPQGVRSGSSVYQVSAASMPALLPNERKRDWVVQGEAVAIDLPNGQTLFALMRTGNLYRRDLALMSMAALDTAFKNDVVESAGRLALDFSVHHKAEVQPNDYPLLVVFADNLVPASAKQVDPKSQGVLGRGFHLTRITAELTNEPITRGIEKRLPWLNTHHGALLHVPLKDFPPPGTPLPLAASITEADFRAN